MSQYLRFFIIFSALFCAIYGAGCSSVEEQNIDSAGRQAEECFQAGDYLCALRQWNIIVKQGGGDSYIFEQIGRAQKRLGNFPAALEAFRKSTEIDAGNISAWEKRAELELFFADLSSASESMGHLEKLGRSAMFYVLKGDLLSIQGKYDAAEDEYRTVIATDPNNIKALTRLAFCLLSQGKSEESFNIYEKLVHLSDKGPSTFANMARYWHARGDQKKARSLFEKAVKLWPENLELKIRLAQFYMDRALYDRAHKIFETIYSENPANTFARKMAIEASMLAGDMATAGKELSALSATEKNELEFAILEGKYNLLKHSLPQAVSCFQEALEQEPDLVIAHYLLGVAYLAMGHGNLGKSELVKALSLDRSFSYADLALAGYFYKLGQLDIAWEYAERVRKREPGNVRAYLLLGAVEMAREHWKEAVKMYRIAKALEPSSSIPDYYGAVVSAWVHDFKEAEKRYLMFLERCPDCMDALYDYVMLLIEEGKRAAAEEFVREKVTRMPNSPWLHAVAGELYLKIDREKEAVDEFIKFVRLAPESTYGYQRLIALLQDNPQQIKQLEALLSEASARPGFNVPDVFLTLAQIYYKTERPDKAVEILEEAKARMPGNADVTNNLAWHYLLPETQNIPRAFSLSIEANELAPDRADIMDTLAWVYYFKGLYTQAHWLLEACLEQGDKSPAVHYHLGMVYAAERRLKDARNHLMIAKEASDDPYIAACMPEIEKTLQKMAREEKRK